MTDAQVSQEGTARNRIAGGVNPWLDWTSRVAIVIVYGGSALIGAASILRLPLGSVDNLLMIAASIANVLFLDLLH